MRVPWPFGRRTPSDGQPSLAPEDARPGASPVDPALDGPASPALAPATGAWATLPSIQRTVSAAPLVAPSALFLAGVSGHRPLPPIVQPLGHESGAAAPPGLVVAHVSPVPSLTSQAPMPTRQVQRRAASSEAPGDDPGPVQDVAEPVRTETTAIPAVSGATAVANTPEAVSAGLPIRQLATVSPAATVTPAARPLTRGPEPVAVARRSTGPARASSAAATSAGRPSAGSFTAPGLSPAVSSGPTPPPRDTGPVRTASRWAESPTVPPTTTPVGLGAPLASGLEVPSRTGVGEAPSISRTTATQPPLTAASRRAGLGAPLAVPPASAVAQPLPGRGLPVRPDAAGQGLAATTPARPSGPTEATASTHSAAASMRQLPILPVLSVSRRRTDEPAAATGIPGASTAAGSPAAVVGAPPAVAAIAGTTIRPTMGARPLHTGVTAQREAAGISPATGDAPSVPAHWASGDDLPPTVRSVAHSPEATLEAEPVPLQRFADLPAAQESAGSSAAMSREIVFPPRDASMFVPQGTAASVAGVPSASGSPSIAGVQRQATPGAPSRFGSPAQPGLPGRTPTPTETVSRGALALARPQGLAQLAASTHAAPVVSRIVAEPTSQAALPSVQTPATGSTGGTAVGGITATPIVQRVDGAAPAAPSEEGHSDSELDELAQALFGRIRTHLRAELIHEREARGLTFDAF